MEINQTEPSVKLLGAAAVRKIAPVSDMTISRWVKAGHFPEPVKIARRNYWRSDDIAKWLDSSHAQRHAA